METPVTSIPNMHFYLHTGMEIDIGIGICMDIDYIGRDISRDK